MSGLQTGVPARNNGAQDVQYLRKRITFDGSAGVGTAAAFTIGTLPANAILLLPLSGIDVQTVFNAGTNNRVQIGNTGSVSKYGLNLSAATVGFVPVAVAIGHKVTVDTPILVTPDITGTAATTGDVEVVIAYVNPN